MSYLFLEYPKCNTCRNAKKWLDEHKITYEDRHIIDRNPSVEELTEWIKRSKLPLKNFFNTSGLVYKEMKLKDKLPITYFLLSNKNRQAEQNARLK